MTSKAAARSQLEVREQRMGEFVVDLQRADALYRTG